MHTDLPLGPSDPLEVLLCEHGFPIRNGFVKKLQRIVDSQSCKPVSNLVCIYRLEDVVQDEQNQWTYAGHQCLCEAQYRPNPRGKKVFAPFELSLATGPAVV